jgi:hypothetical protein
VFHRIKCRSKCRNFSLRHLKFVQWKLMRSISEKYRIKNIKTRIALSQFEMYLKHVIVLTNMQTRYILECNFTILGLCCSFDRLNCVINRPALHAFILICIKYWIQIFKSYCSYLQSSKNLAAWNKFSYFIG